MISAFQFHKMQLSTIRRHSSSVSDKDIIYFRNQSKNRSEELMKPKYSTLSIPITKIGGKKSNISKTNNMSSNTELYDKVTVSDKDDLAKKHDKNQLNDMDINKAKYLTGTNFCVRFTAPFMMLTRCS